jgi:hypothetical protein
MSERGIVCERNAFVRVKREECAKDPCWLSLLVTTNDLAEYRLISQTNEHHVRETTSVTIAPGTSKVISHFNSNRLARTISFKSKLETNFGGLISVSRLDAERMETETEFVADLFSELYGVYYIKLENMSTTREEHFELEVQMTDFEYSNHLVSEHVVGARLAGKASKQRFDVATLGSSVIHEPIHIEVTPFN